MTDLTHDFMAQIRAAAAAGQTLTIEGGGTKHWYGNRVAGDLLLKTNGHTGIVDYDPAELVLTARTGTTLREVEQALADRGQMLAFEPPRHGPEATLGGAIATALSGPGRPFVGGVRDFVLGLHVVDGRGTLLKFGGQVMKNVAGYDVSRLMTGALGVLGLITQVSLKVLPVPTASATLRFAMDEATAIHQVNTWSGQPLPLTGTLWRSGVLYVRFSGARAAVDAAISALSMQFDAERLDDAQAQGLWNGARDQRDGYFQPRSTAERLWRLSLPATANQINSSQLSGAEDQLIEWGGAQRWLWSTDEAPAVQQLARQLGGHAVSFDNRQTSMNVFDQPSAGLMAIQRRLKQTFDPQGVFNPGRLYLDL